ncbi:MAG TPA: hypothetical protein ENK57_04135 [Polyangiaceae bacterium]|nr:hypothetical protein [Polyangiaceae bacterium]
MDYPVIAHGGSLVLTGFNLLGTTEVSIGGVSHTNLSAITATSVTVDEVSDSVPVGLAVDMTVTTPIATSSAFALTVIHLIINELEADSPGRDDQEFIELDIGFAAEVSLDGYVVVQFNGATSGSPSLPGRVYGRVDLAGTGTRTRANGLLVIGDADLYVASDIPLPGSIQNGEDAVAIYQFVGDAALFPEDYATVGNTGLIDALIYESGDDTDRIAIRPLATDGAVVNEGRITSARDTVSIQRCPSDVTRRLGASYRVEIPSPGIANYNCGGAVADLADCTINFSGTCPNLAEGVCGATFAAHAPGSMCHTIGMPACSGSGTSFHTIAPDERIDVFLSGNLNDLTTFLAPYMGTMASMRFFTLDGSEVGSPISVGVDCAVGTPPTSNTGDLGTGAVRRIQIEGDADIWVDDFRVNPAP